MARDRSCVGGADASLAVLFYNVGGYHLARLQAAADMCAQQGWRFSAVQICGRTDEHPWGDLEAPDFLTTLTQHQHGGTPSLADKSLLLRRLDQLNPSHVAIPGWGFDFARAALSWCRRHRRVPILMSESKADDAPRTFLKEAVKRWGIIRHFPVAIVGGKLHRKYLQQLGMGPERIAGGYDVVDNKYFAREVRRYRHERAMEWQPSTLRGRRTIVAVNRFIPRKNLLRLIRAFAGFLATREPAERPTWCLALLGGGEQRVDLEERAARLGIREHVEFPGFCSYDEVPRWYAAAEMFVHPAEAEQWGLVVNEAMAARLPVIVSRTCGCFPDLIEEGRTGLGFTPTDVNDLQRAICRLADDGAFRNRLAQNGAEHLDRYYGPEQFGDGLRQCVDWSTEGPKV